MVEAQNMIRAKDIGGGLRMMKLNQEHRRLGILVHLILGVHPIIWMTRQVMVKDKRELFTMEGKELLEGLLLSICASVDIPFLGEQSHQTKTSLMLSPKVVGNKAEGLAKTSKNELVELRSARL
ncbi:unnamed protein product, partial [Urochloa humidicola]